MHVFRGAWARPAGERASLCSEASLLPVLRSEASSTGSRLCLPAERIAESPSLRVKVPVLAQAARPNAREGRRDCQASEGTQEGRKGAG